MLAVAMAAAAARAAPPGHDVRAVLERRDAAEALRLALRAVDPCARPQGAPSASYIGFQNGERHEDKSAN